MPFYDKLRKNLENKLDVKKLNLLPRSYYVLGKILILKLNPSLLRDRKLIGKAILEMLPYIHTVCLEKAITGVNREPKIEVIAGCKSTETLHKEHGAQFFMDVSQVMWSKGNKEERARMLKTVKKNETVVDMFAGVGYWSIFLAKKAKKVYSIDINPRAAEFLRKNAFLNKVSDKIEVLEGDCRDFADLLEGKADRIVMGYLYGTEQFLPYALKMVKPKCTIHFHKNVAEQDILKVKKSLEKYGSVKFRKVKSYAPKIWHMVYDIKLSNQF